MNLRITKGLCRAVLTGTVLMLVPWAPQPVRAQAAAGADLDQIAKQAAQLVNAKDYDRAIPYLNRLIAELTPQMTANNSARRAVDFATFHLAVASYEKSDYAGAIARLKDYLVQLEPAMQGRAARLVR